ncbi:MAG TPA: YegP family protein [Acidimicrobiales bacterium]|nr:YegP family protein [Acidimicrobiales bacterium]
MPAKFQLKKGSTGKFRFTLLSTNGQVVATSQAYERKATAMAGIRSVQKIAGTAEIEDTTTKEWADADTAAKAAKKSAKKAPAKAAGAAKKVVTKPAKAAAPASKKRAAASTGTPRKSVAAAATRPVRKAPPPLTTAPKNLTPKL